MIILFVWYKRGWQHYRLFLNVKSCCIFLYLFAHCSGIIFMYFFCNISSVRNIFLVLYKFQKLLHNFCYLADDYFATLPCRILPANDWDKKLAKIYFMKRKPSLQSFTIFVIGAFKSAPTLDIYWPIRAAPLFSTRRPYGLVSHAPHISKPKFLR